jgi:enolase
MHPYTIVRTHDPRILVLIHPRSTFRLHVGDRVQLAGDGIFVTNPERIRCGIALSLAYPVREYIAQRQQVDQLVATRQAMQVQVKKLGAETKLSNRIVTAGAVRARAAL